MRTLIIGLAFILTGSAGGQAVTASAAPFEQDIQSLASQLGLASLTNGALNGDQEVRVWTGFGILGVQLIRAVRHRGTWTVTATDEVSAGLPFHRWSDSRRWTERWTAALADSVAALPPAPRRPADAGFTTDGWSIVIESADARGYHISGADNPQLFCSRDDRRMLRVVAALKLHANPNCIVH